MFGSGGVPKSVYIYKKTQKSRTDISVKYCSNFLNSSRFSREPPGLPLSDFWEPRGLCRVLWTPRALDLVRPATTLTTLLFMQHTSVTLYGRSPIFVE